MNNRIFSAEIAHNANPAFSIAINTLNIFK